MQAFQVISLTLLFVMAANAQVFVWGKCPMPAVQENFDASQVNPNSPLLFLLLAFSLFVCASIVLFFNSILFFFISVPYQFKSTSFVNRTDYLWF